MAAKTSQNLLIDKIARLKVERKAVIVAHNYQIGEIQDVADLCADSLELAKECRKTNAEVIVFCGVHFMAETAAIMNPEKIVLLPDLGSGCGMADMVTPEKVRALKEQYPGSVVVCYVNSSAAVKAESDICCTSSNAVKVVESISKYKQIIFIPDQYLGKWVAEQTGREMILFNGYCPTHVRIMSSDIDPLRKRYPGAEVMVHPETTPEVTHAADRVLSTSGIAREAAKSSSQTIIVGTEIGMLHRLEKENPGKKFIPACKWCDCGYMKKNTLEKVLWALEDLQPRITVSKEVADRARGALERMMVVV